MNLGQLKQHLLVHGFSFRLRYVLTYAAQPPPIWINLVWALVSFHNQKIFELPQVRCIELGLVVTTEEVGVVLQRVPVRGSGDELPQIRLANVEHIVVGQVIWHAEPPAWVLKHPHAGSNDGYGHLHGGGVVMRHKPTGLLDVEAGTAPPRLIWVAHHQNTQNVSPADNFVGHNTDTRLQPVVAAAQLVEGSDSAIARAIGVVDRG